MSYYTAEGFANINWDSTAEAACIKWMNFNIRLNQYRSLMSNLIRLLKDKASKKILVDTSETKGTLPQQIIDEYVQHILPQLTTIGIKYIATVIPKSAVRKLTTHSWQTEQVGKITTINVGSFFEAQKWLTNQRL